MPPMDGIQSTTVAAAGTDREVSLAPMFFGYGLCVHHNKLRKIPRSYPQRRKQFCASFVPGDSLLPLALEIVPGILCTYPYVQI